MTASHFARRHEMIPAISKTNRVDRSSIDTMLACGTSPPFPCTLTIGGSRQKETSDGGLSGSRNTVCNRDWRWFKFRCKLGHEEHI